MSRADIRSARIAQVRAAIADCERAGEPRMALSLTSELNHHLSEALEAGET